MALSNKKLISLAKRYKEIQAQEAQLKKEKDEIKDLLKEEMKDRDLKELLLDVYKITYSNYDISKFDSKTFEQDHKKLYEKYIVTTNAEKLLVNLGK